MPKKIRELKAALKNAGFVLLKGRGKGSHSMWEHPLVPNSVILSGKDGDDADRYKEKDVKKALADLKQALSEENTDE
jgi:predicted RNA binding protein YcfA (HicA-like mRNA interferase family)